VLALTTFYWGAVSAHLPQRAYAHGTDVSVFFVAEAGAVLLLRAPSGWLADQISPTPLVHVGIISTLVGVVLLAQEPSALLLVIAGLSCGTGGALAVTSILLILQRRSSDSDRGNAFALFTLAIASGTAAGSLVSGLVVSVFGFGSAMAVGAACLITALGVAHLANYKSLGEA
jgi:predicted MFS family arabinose efflux permease